jgi:hypothetical protein
MVVKWLVLILCRGQVLGSNTDIGYPGRSFVVSYNLLRQFLRQMNPQHSLYE